MKATRLSGRQGERGVAALFVTVLLCLAMVLAVALAQRNVDVEEQRSANELRATSAFEAAEAGLDWALARINDPTPVDDECRPSGDASAKSVRERLLRIGVPGGELVPMAWSDAGAARTLQAACVRDAEGWRCSCPRDRAPDLASTAGAATAPAFVVELAAGSREDLVRVLATGCTRTGPGAVCAASSDAEREATARLEAAWALLPSLRSLPPAALMVRGDVDVGVASLGVSNDQAASGGLAALAGGRIAAPGLRVGFPAGSSLGGSLASNDATLHDLTADRFFARTFGMGLDAWTAQPAARHVVCDGDCAPAVSAAIAAGARLLVLDGDAVLSGPATFGGIDDPIALVATGVLRISGDVAVFGVVHAAALEWNDASPGAAFVRGAVLSGGDYRGNAAVDLRRDDAVLARLAATSGSFVRVLGSWKDF